MGGQVRDAIGLDVGGTKMLGGLVDETGAVRDRFMRETPVSANGPAVLEDAVVAAVNQLRDAHEVVAVGVGAAGLVDHRGTVLFAPHLAWRGRQLQVVLSTRLGLPILVDNDANMAARAEMRFGAGRGHRHAICVTIGTGIGGAVVVDGTVLRGAFGLAGEIGHIQVVPDGLHCECEQRGCWEQYCSGRALIRAARPGGPPYAVTNGEEVTLAALAGASWAVDAFETVGEWLGIGLASLASTFDPEIVIVGGGVSGAGDLLLDPAREALRRRLPGGAFRPEIPVVPAELGPDAGFVGAADAARALLG